MAADHRPTARSQEERIAHVAVDPFGGLPAGTSVGKYEVVEVLGQGGFGITYRARDAQLRRDVAMKEYLPTHFAMRQSATQVMPRSTQTADSFLWGRERFLEEARTLARLGDAPGIVNVYDFMEANGTAYMIMELIAGETVEARLKREQRLQQPAIEMMLYPLLDGLERVHAAGFLHRDIKPANILLDSAGRPTLIDFGASRAALQDRSQAMTAVYTAGYAAPEQMTSARQGPWTDVYAMAGTLYHCVTGRAPGNALERLTGDAMVPAAAAGKGKYAPSLLAAIDAGLTLKPTDRPQSIADWREVLSGISAPVMARESAATAGPGSGRPPWLWVGAAGLAMAVGIGGTWLVLRPGAELMQRAEVERAKPEASRRQAEEEAAQRAAAEARQRQEQEAAQRREEEARRAADEKARTEAARRHDEEAAQRREEEARRVADEKARTEAARRQDEEAARRREEEARRMADEKARTEASRRQDEEAARHREEEARRVADEKARADASRRLSEEKARAEAARRQDEEAARRREEEARRQPDEKARTGAPPRQDEEVTRRREEEARRTAEEKQRTEADLQRQAEAGEASLGLSERDRRRVQVALTSLGFNTQGTDGALGPRSRQMIAGWQRENGMPTTGYLTAAQYAELMRRSAAALQRWEDEVRRNEEEARRRPPAPTVRPGDPVAGPDGAWSGTYNCQGESPGRISLQIAGGRGVFRDKGRDLEFTVVIQGAVATGRLTLLTAMGHEMSGALTGQAGGRDLVVRGSIGTPRWTLASPFCTVTLSRQ